MKKTVLGVVLVFLANISYAADTHKSTIYSLAFKIDGQVIVGFDTPLTVCSSNVVYKVDKAGLGFYGFERIVPLLIKAAEQRKEVVVKYTSATSTSPCYASDLSVLY